MMKKQHLTPQELEEISSNKPMSKEQEQHLKQCLLCQKNLKDFEETLKTFKSFNNIKTISSPQEIDEIANLSFKFINEQQTKQKSFPFFKMALGIAASVLIFLTFFLFTHTSKKTKINLVKTSKTKMLKKRKKPANKTKFLSKTYKEYAKSTIKTKRAILKILNTSVLKQKNDNEIFVKSGKIHFSVSHGKNFKIHIRQRYIVRDLGTKFIIAINKNIFKLIMEEGLVEVFDKFTGKTMAFTKDMTYSFFFTKNIVRKHLKKVKIEKLVKKNIETLSFLEQGRKLLEQNKINKAKEFFIKSLKEEKNKAKALFEILKIEDNDKNYKELLRFSNKHKNLLLSQSVYEEELLIKSCKAEIKTKIKKRQYCSKYLEIFPNGYKANEIKRALK